MATQKGKFIKGTVGPVVYRPYRGKQVIQARPNFTALSQSKGTKEAASIFGIASNLAGEIRNHLEPGTGFSDGTMFIRLTAELLYVLRGAKNPGAKKYNFKARSFERLDGFEFNINSPLRKQIFVAPVLRQEPDRIIVELPEMKIPQDLKFPKEASACLLGVSMVSFDLDYGHVKPSELQYTELPYGYHYTPYPARNFEFELVPGCLGIVVMSLNYVSKTFNGNLVLNSKLFSPAVVLKAFVADGQVDPELTKSWKSIQFKNG